MNNYFLKKLASFDGTYYLNKFLKQSGLEAETTEDNFEKYVVKSPIVEKIKKEIILFVKKYDSSCSISEVQVGLDFSANPIFYIPFKGINFIKTLTIDEEKLILTNAEAKAKEDSSVTEKEKETLKKKYFEELKDKYIEEFREKINNELLARLNVKFYLEPLAKLYPKVKENIKFDKFINLENFI